MALFYYIRKRKIPKLVFFQNKAATQTPLSYLITHGLSHIRKKEQGPVHTPVVLYSRRDFY